MASKDQYKATTKVVRRIGEKIGVTYKIFDCLDYEEFISQNCTVKYSDRRKAMENLFDGMRNVEVLPSIYTGNDLSIIPHFLSQVQQNQQEGLMANINDAPYEFKRTQNLLKVKVMQDVDLPIVGFEEGQGRLSGTLGRMNVLYKGNIVGVGSGMTDTQRAYLWRNQDKLIGRIAEIRFFEETQDKDGNFSLRFPVLSELREIGKEENY
jgi:DNA ligase-1